MTGGSNIRERIGAVFFAAVMVVSMVAIGGFAGSAAASATNITGNSADDVEKGGNAQQPQDVNFDVTIDGASSSETIAIDHNDDQNVYSAEGDVGIAGTSAVSIDSGDTGEVSVGSVTDQGDGTIDITLNDDTQDNTAHTVTVTVTLQIDASGETAESETYSIEQGGTSDTVDFSITGADNPSISSVATRDAGTPSGSPLADGPDGQQPTANNGQVDQVVITFDEAVDDETVDFEDFVIDDATNDPTIDSVHTGATSDDDTLILELQEGGNIDGGFTGDTGVTAMDLSIDDNDENKANSLKDPAGNEFGGYGSDSDVSDGAAPAVVSADSSDPDNDGNVEEYDISLSETITDTDIGLDSGTDDHFSLGTNSVNDVTDAGSDNDENLRVIVDSDPGQSGVQSISGTSVTETLNVDGSSGTAITDGTNANSQDYSLTTTDSASPVLTSFTATTGQKQATVTFSEGVEDGGGNAIVAGDFNSYSGGGTDATAISSVNHNAGNSDATLTLNNQITANDIDSDTVTAGGPIEDGQGNTEVGSAITLTSGAAALPGSTGNDMKFQIDSDTTAEVVAGSANETVGAITLKDDASNGQIAFASDITITLPQGVTVNQSASALNTQNIITSDSGGVTIDSVSVDNSDNQGEITLSTSGQSNPGEEILFKTGILVLNVDGDAVDTSSQTGPSATSTNLDITVDNFQGEAPLSSAIDVRSTSATDPNGGVSIAAGADNIAGGGNGFSGQNDLVRIDKNNIINTVEGTDRSLIGNQTEIVYSLQPGTGVTFDTDNIGSSFLQDTDIDDADTDDELDESGITVTEKQISVPVADAFEDADTTTDHDIDIENFVFETSGDASNADLNVTVEAPPASSAPYTTDSGSGSLGTIENYVTIQNPDLNVDNNNENLAVGLDEQGLKEGGGNLESQAAIELEVTSDAQIEPGTNVTLSLNNSDVTFDTSRGTNTETGGGGASDASDDGTLDAGFNTQDVDVDAVTINENSLDISVVEGDESDTDDGDTLEIGDVGLNVSTTASDDVDVEFQATTKSATDAPTVTVTSTASKNDPSSPETEQFVTLKRPNFELNGNRDQAVSSAQNSNVTLDLDADGFAQQPVATGSDALVIKSTALGQIADTTNVTVTLEEGTGVTFDTSAATGTSIQTSADDQVIDASVSGGNSEITVDGVAVSEKSIDIQLSDDSSNNQGTGPDAQHDINSEIVLDDLLLNATGSASTTELSVTTNATVSNPDDTQDVGSGSDADGSGTFTNSADNRVTTTLSKVINFDQVSGDQIRIDPDVNTGGFNPGAFGEDAAANKPTVDETVAAGVEVQDGSSAFGGATVDLDIISTPEGSSGAQLNTTQVTTNQNGQARFNFTAGDTTGDYVVNATVEQTGAGVNVTYTAQPGGIDGVTVTPIENAIAQDGTGDTAVAALFVNSTDANGNKVTGSSPTVEISADNVGSSEVDSTDNFDNTKGDVSGINSGTFSLDSADGSSIIYVKSSQVEDVTISATISGNSDSGTVTFFDQVSQVDLALNQSTVEVDDTVAAEATLSESDGTTIEVPDVTVNYDDNNDGNTTFAGGTDSDSASTNDAGVASVNVTAEQLGSSTIDAQSNLRSDSATLNIVEDAGPQPVATVTFDNKTVQNGTEEITVESANFTRADGSAGDYVVVVHVVNATEFDGGVDNSISAPVGASGDLTGAEGNITVDLNRSAAFEDGDALDSLTENVTLRAMLHTTDNDSAFGTRLGSAIDGLEPGDETDDANITVQDEPASDPVERFDTNGEPGIQSGEVLDAISAFNEGEEGVEAGDVLDVISAFNEA